MTLVLYAVAESQLCTDEPGEGIGGRPLRAVTHDRLAALVSEQPQPFQATEGALREYEQAVEYLMTAMPLLPARFATAIESDSLVAQLLRERQEEFLEAIGRVRGAVELGLRAQWPALGEDDAADANDVGTRYMRLRLERQRRGEEIARIADVTFADLARARSARTVSGRATALNVSYLVTLTDVDEFLRRLRKLEAQVTDATFVCTGPWPPYSFSSPNQR
jgi:hypothetical protein